MKNINTSLFDFPTIRDPNRNYVYVDKTAQLYEIAKPTADCIYYLPRPRRFGKSLMLSTLKALFEGRRKLFEGLAIEKTDWAWEQEIYPVLHLDMSKVASKTADELEVSLKNLVEAKAREFSLPFDASKSAKDNFCNLLSALPGVAPAAANGKYVVLIDEYDAPIAGLLDTPEGREELRVVRKTLHDFYVQAKSECGNMRFLMVTGVSKFAKTSIFSAFNNPKDLTLDVRTADLLGYTHEEMETYFHEHIQAFADEKGITYGEMFAKLLEWYDGYQFSPKKLVRVVNPVSLGNVLSNRVIANYWEATAGSTLIFDALKAGNKTPVDFADEFALSSLDAADALEAPAVALLYQGGYLTINESLDDLFVSLKIPNEEVCTSLYRGHMAAILGKDFEIDGFMRAADRTAKSLLAEGVGEKFVTFLRAGFSKLPHDWVAKDEREAKRAFAAFMAFTGSHVYGECQQAQGRPDAILETDKAVYVFEFKFDKSAREALDQCRKKNYAAPYAADPRQVWYVALNYSAATRTIDDPLCERVK